MGTIIIIINMQLLNGFTGRTTPPLSFSTRLMMVFMQLVEGIKTVRDHTKILKLTKSSESGSACFNPIPPGLFEGGTAWGGRGGGGAESARGL